MLMNEILEKIESYDFKDPLGHELKMCVEWKGLKEEIKIIIAERDRYMKKVLLNIFK